MVKLKLQIYSDYHAEWFYPKEPFLTKITAIAPILVLAGDMCSFGIGTNKYIASFTRLLNYCSQNWDLVIYIPGNHEYYNFSRNNKANSDWLTIYEIDKKIKEMCDKYKNIKYLNNSSFPMTISDIKGNSQKYRFLGTTLFGYIPDSIKFDISAHKNDFYQISAKKGQNITVDELNQIHLKSINFLKKGIELSKKEHSIPIIITHHQPYITKNNFCFHDMSVDTMDLIKPPIKLWIMGHMHNHRNIKINGVRIIENGMGYPNERTGYQKDFYVLI